MTRAPRITRKQVVAALSRAGFVVDRVRGSHHFLRHPDGRVTVVPIHGEEVIGSGLLTSILRTCELSVEEFRALHLPLEPTATRSLSLRDAQIRP